MRWRTSIDGTGVGEVDHLGEIAFEVGAQCVLERGAASVDGPRIPPGVVRLIVPGTK